jgi:hypothetical protein
VVRHTFRAAPRPPDLPKPRLTLAFHGTRDSQVCAAYNAMVNRDMRGAFYIDPAKVDKDDGPSSEDLEKLRKWGHDIVEGMPPGGAVGPGKTLEELCALVDRAFAERKPVELVFGATGEEDLGAASFTKDDFRELCEYIHTKGFLVVPSRELHR